MDHWKLRSRTMSRIVLVTCILAPTYEYNLRKTRFHRNQRNKRRVVVILARKKLNGRSRNLIRKCHMKSFMRQFGVRFWRSPIRVLLPTLSLDDVWKIVSGAYSCCIIKFR